MSNVRGLLSSRFELDSSPCRPSAVSYSHTYECFMGEITLTLRRGLNVKTLRFDAGHGTPHQVALAEWLRRVPAKYMGFPRESSNLSGDDTFLPQQSARIYIDALSFHVQQGE
ncbi:hypothetical protein Ancab_032443 [Ancistrocladus abbreviatus]